MTAKEMFEELGYKEKKDKSKTITFQIEIGNKIGK